MEKTSSEILEEVECEDGLFFAGYIIGILCGIFIGVGISSMFMVF